MAVGYNLVLFLAYYYIFLNCIQPKHFYTNDSSADMLIFILYAFLPRSTVRVWNIPAFLLSQRKINLRKQAYFPACFPFSNNWISLLTHLHSQYYPCLLIKLLHNSLSGRSQRFLNFHPCKLVLTLNIFSLAPSGDFKCSFMIFHILPPPHGCLSPRTVSDFSRELGPRSKILPPQTLPMKHGLSGMLWHFSLLLAHPNDTEQAEKNHKKEDKETKSRCCQRLKKQRVISCLAARELPEKTWEFPDF